MNVFYPQSMHIFRSRWCMWGDRIIGSDETPSVLTLVAGDVRSFDALCESCGLQLVWSQATGLPQLQPLSSAGASDVSGACYLWSFTVLRQSGQLCTLCHYVYDKRLCAICLLFWGDLTKAGISRVPGIIICIYAQQVFTDRLSMRVAAQPPLLIN